MRSSASASRYARALFALAKETENVADVRRELDELAALLDENPALGRSLFRPLHPAAQRRGLLRAVCARAGTSRRLRNFYFFLIDQRRLVDFNAIRHAFGRLADEADGRTRAEVVSATPLRDDQRNRLRQALSVRTGHRVEMSEAVDPSLLGGVIARVGGLVFDGSLRTQLSQLRANLTRGH